MANIVENILGDKALQLGNEEFLRQFSFGTDWRSIRIGLRWGVNMSGTLATPAFVIGVNSGTTYGYRDANTVEFAGATLAHGSTTWTYAAGPPAYFSYGWYRTYTRIAGVTTSYISSSLGVYGPILPTRGIIYLDVVKKTATGQLTAGLVQPSNPATAQTDWTQDWLYRFMDVDITPWSGAWGGGGVAMTYNGNYTFDSVSISWNDAVNTIEISDILVTRFY